MFTIYNEKTKHPIKVWLPDEGHVEKSCLEQAYNLSNLPFVHKWVCLMPDTHTGMGMPIGGIIAAKRAIIPNAVGVDIGCGMAFVGTDIKVDEIKNIKTGSGTLIQGMIGEILRNIPTGFNKHKQPQKSKVLDLARNTMEKYRPNPELCKHIDLGFYQVGSLGGGNHFIELQEDEEGYLGIMVHSGSRNFGKQVCDYFNDVAKKLNHKWPEEIPHNWRLSALPTDSKEGQQYINWMTLALDFAAENRYKMLEETEEIVRKWMDKHTNISYTIGNEDVGRVNCHHNYAALEHHYGKDVWVHRKGATRAGAGEKAVIPGAMGSFSYVVEGLGNKESFCSSSHGAGRLYSRKGAMAEFSKDEVIKDLKELGVVLGKHNKKDVAEESRFAYKNIDEVMNSQKDLVKPVKKLKTIGVVKG